ncbi:MAG: type II toxin-antitoxin system VapB family antitoxin [Hyphomonadaceae bacterium]|jgi:hypothetical protein|nr:type II toxin-antitoxin system VapB family antitoxin [Hyphomonadaceae bacterium]
MGKALSIKDEATYELVADLASKTGVSMTQAVNDAVAHRLDELAKLRETEAADWLARVKGHNIAADFMADRWQPPLEPRKP